MDKSKDTNMLVYFALGNAKFWGRVHCPTSTPDARYFESQWNIGFTCISRNMWAKNKTICYFLKILTFMKFCGDYYDIYENKEFSLAMHYLES